MATISQLIDRVIGVEGGYSNHPADKGGPTRWGVTEQVARAYGYAGDMRALPRVIAAEIYRKRYWEEPGFARVAEIAPALAEELFDTGINMGTAIAATFLQRALNVLNRQARDYPDIVADGRIGTMTIAALKGLLQKRGSTAGEKVLLTAAMCLQGARYIEIAEARPANEEFEFGWLFNRVGPVA